MAQINYFICFSESDEERIKKEGGLIVKSIFKTRLAEKDELLILDFPIGGKGVGDLSVLCQVDKVEDVLLFKKNGIDKLKETNSKQHLIFLSVKKIFNFN